MICHLWQRKTPASIYLFENKQAGRQASCACSNNRVHVNGIMSILNIYQSKEDGSVGCCLVRSADAEALLHAKVNLSKNASDACELPVFLSPRDSLLYLSRSTSQQSESNKWWWRLLQKNVSASISVLASTFDIVRPKSPFQLCLILDKFTPF